MYEELYKPVSLWVIKIVSVGMCEFCWSKNRKREFKAPSYTTPETFSRKQRFHYENASNGFHPHYAVGVKSTSITDHFGFVVEENSGREITFLS